MYWTLSAWERLLSIVIIIYASCILAGWHRKSEIRIKVQYRFQRIRETKWKYYTVGISGLIFSVYFLIQNPLFAYVLQQDSFSTAPIYMEYQEKINVNNLFTNEETVVLANLKNEEFLGKTYVSLEGYETEKGFINVSHLNLEFEQEKVSFHNLEFTRTHDVLFEKPVVLDFDGIYMIVHRLFLLYFSFIIFLDFMLFAKKRQLTDQLIKKLYYRASVIPSTIILTIVLVFSLQQFYYSNRLDQRWNSEDYNHQIGGSIEEDLVTQDYYKEALEKLESLKTNFEDQKKIYKILPYLVAISYQDRLSLEEELRFTNEADQSSLWVAYEKALDTYFKSYISEQDSYLPSFLDCGMRNDLAKLLARKENDSAWQREFAVLYSQNLKTSNPNGYLKYVRDYKPVDYDVIDYIFTYSTIFVSEDNILVAIANEYDCSIQKAYNIRYQDNFVFREPKNEVLD